MNFARENSSTSLGDALSPASSPSLSSPSLSLSPQLQGSPASPSPWNYIDTMLMVTGAPTSLGAFDAEHFTQSFEVAASAAASQKWPNTASSFYPNHHRRVSSYDISHAQRHTQRASQSTPSGYGRFPSVGVEDDFLVGASPALASAATSHRRSSSSVAFNLPASQPPLASVMARNGKVAIPRNARSPRHSMPSLFASPEDMQRFSTLHTIPAPIAPPKGSIFAAAEFPQTSSSSSSSGSADINSAHSGSTTSTESSSPEIIATSTMRAGGKRASISDASGGSVKMSPLMMGGDGSAAAARLRRHSVANPFNHLHHLPPLPASNPHQTSAPTTEFRCPVPGCEKSFSRIYSLQSHMKVHSEERPFICLECGLGFLRQHDFKRHGKTHSGEKPFQCANCNKTFTRSDALTRHLRVGSCPFSNSNPPFSTTATSNHFTQTPFDGLLLHVADDVNPGSGNGIDEAGAILLFQNTDEAGPADPTTLQLPPVNDSASPGYCYYGHQPSRSIG